MSETTTLPDLSAATPVEIDTVLAEAYQVVAVARARIRSELEYAERQTIRWERMSGAGEVISLGAERAEQEKADVEARVNRYRDQIDEAEAQAAPFHAEYGRRPWVRY